MLFDLDHDPLEMRNLLDSPADSAARRIADELRRRITGWERGASFEIHLDLEAPIIAASNARRGTEDEREPVIRYYSESMRRIRNEGRGWVLR